MTVQRIEFSGRALASFDKAQLISYLDINPHLVANYQVFPQSVRRAALEPALVVETRDLSDRQLTILAVGMGLVMGQLEFVTPA